MIVRNEAHIVREVLDTVAPYITYWVIVDTGSDDGTPDVVRNHLDRLGIPGEIHERRWQNFGHNRSEAMTLARGHGDYIWVIDADDLVVGPLDFSHLDADVYEVRYGPGTGFTYWRRQLFRDQMPWRYEGVVHEYAECDEPFVSERLEGAYYIDSRRLGGRSLDPEKYARDRDLLLAEVERNPDDSRSVFYLAQSYYDLGDYENARDWYARRADMGGWDEEVYCAMFRLGEAMSQIGAPWQETQDAYLRAWEFRPTRAEPLHAIAYSYRVDQRYQLGHLFAERAASIPFPVEDTLFVGADVYAFRAVDEQAVCASWIGRHAEALTLCRRLLAARDLSEDDRARIATNRDISVPAMIDAASSYPERLARSLTAGPRDSEVTVSLVAGPDRRAVEQTLNSFLNSCNDVTSVGRLIVVDAGLSAEARATLLEAYRFLEFTPSPAATDRVAHLGQIRKEIASRFWLHVGEGWRFFAPEDLIGRLTGVLEAEREVFQVAVNVDDATTLSGVCAPESSVRRAAKAGRYVLTNSVANGPAMYETTRLDRAATPPVGRARHTVAAGLRNASLDEVLCILGA
ncbi:glycosyltransferase [Mycobacterium hodleri]|uniref:Glycosyltransferase n=2 Tax=Mycolicibacterium hodleri TaxID=49897 RepID=A0A502ECW2_9MYCO|nr:glycosyltransferase [Mycolicibacterium hodleri]